MRNAKRKKRCRNLKKSDASDVKTKESVVAKREPSVKKKLSVQPTRLRSSAKRRRWPIRSPTPMMSRTR